MSTNILKQKREDLLAKIKQIRTYISAAPQDENTGNLLSYLSDLEKDVNGKKYGLIFEEHQEEIALDMINVSNCLRKLCNFLDGVDSMLSEIKEWEAEMNSEMLSNIDYHDSY